MYNVHIEADQRLHQGNGDIGVEVVASSFKHWVPEETMKEIAEPKMTDKNICLRPSS